MPSHSEISAAASMAILVGVIGLRTFLTRRTQAKAGKLLNEASQAMNAGDWATAQAHLQRCVKQFPSSTVARRLHGRALAQLGQLDRAEEELKMAIALEPRVPDHQADLGLFYLRHKSPADGMKCLEDAFTLDPTLRQRLRDLPGLAASLPEPARAQLFGV